MYLFLSHPLDPKDLAWPGEPVVQVKQCTDITDDCPFASFISTVPNHCGTHMDAPRHFVPGGLNINQLGMEYFCHENVLFLDIPKGDAEGVTKADLEPHADEIAKVSALIIRTGFGKYRNTEPLRYQNHGPYLAPDAGKWLSDTFDNLKVVGFDFLALGSPDPTIPADQTPPFCHRHILGYFSGKFVTAVEDMKLDELPAGAKIKRFFNAPLRIVGLDSSQVCCIAEIE